MDFEEIRFCPYCATELDKGARFCKNCGKKILLTSESLDTSNASTDERENLDKDDPKTETKNRTQRQTVYEGIVHKCPQCGEELRSFSSKCPTCGYEVRDTKSTNSIKDFERRLSRIESKTMPVREKKESFMKSVFGRDFKDSDEKDEAREEFEEQKEHEKISLILNYPIPNSREDLLEFALLASSNVDANSDASDDLSKAWMSKLEQIYKKSKIVLKDPADLEQIKSMYEYSKRQNKIKKYKPFALLASLFIVLFVMMGFEEKPGLTILILVLTAAIAALVFAKSRKRNDRNK